jgi:carbon-monoxide dehydrogenase medium subunit
MIPSRFNYYRPASLAEALAFITEHQDNAKLLAGGQSLVSLLKLRLANPEVVVDLGGIEGLSYIREEGDGKGGILIGAMTTYVDLMKSELLQERCRMLPQAARVVGDVQVRNRGTLGGCIAHADPAGDVPAAILALRAELKAVGAKGERWIRAEDFFQGMYATELGEDEILTEVRVPAWDGYKSAYMKMARRPSDFAIAGVAACFKTSENGTCEDIAVGVTGVTDMPYRATVLEAKLKGQKLTDEVIAAAAPAITEGMELIGNMHGSPDFRAHLAKVYLPRVLSSAS